MFQTTNQSINYKWMMLHEAMLDCWRVALILLKVRGKINNLKMWYGVLWTIFGSHMQKDSLMVEWEWEILSYIHDKYSSQKQYSTVSEVGFPIPDVGNTDITRNVCWNVTLPDHIADSTLLNTVSTWPKNIMKRNEKCIQRLELPHIIIASQPKLVTWKNVSKIHLPTLHDVRAPPGRVSYQVALVVHHLADSALALALALDSRQILDPELLLSTTMVQGCGWFPPSYVQVFLGGATRAKPAGRRFSLPSQTWSPRSSLHIMILSLSLWLNSFNQHDTRGWDRDFSSDPSITSWIQFLLSITWRRWGTLRHAEWLHHKKSTQTCGGYIAVDSN